MYLPLQTVRQLLEIHYDRRHRLYDYLEQLSAEELDRDLKVGWKSIRNLLLHSIEAEEFWVQYGIQKGARPDFDFDRYADLESIRNLSEEVRSRTEAFIFGLTDGEMARSCEITFSSGTRVEFTLSKAILHFITHDWHHRGQVLALTRQMGHTPPDLDLI